MIFKKRLNNNAVIAEDEKGTRRYWWDAGLGFRKRKALR